MLFRSCVGLFHTPSPGCPGRPGATDNWKQTWSLFPRRLTGGGYKIIVFEDYITIFPNWQANFSSAPFPVTSCRRSVTFVTISVTVSLPDRQIFPRHNTRFWLLCQLLQKYLRKKLDKPGFFRYNTRSFRKSNKGYNPVSSPFRIWKFW